MMRTIFQRYKKKSPFGGFTGRNPKIRIKQTRARKEIDSAASGGSGGQGGSVPKAFIPLRGFGHFCLFALANKFARYQTKTPVHNKMGRGI
jgi:hypothetical protein